MAELTAIVDASAQPISKQVDPVQVPTPSSIVDDVSPEEYIRRAELCLEHIRVGDIYQVQLGHEMTITTAADDISVYRRLRWRNPSPYMSVIPLAGRVILGASPELFIRFEDGLATMRPIAGTARRGSDEDSNAIAVERLLSDPKERAEHIMLVDLTRNDLGRVAVPMTVEVVDLMIIEAYSHMYHIVSNVTSLIVDGKDVYDVIKACFPAGTMTGAPKVRAMEIIESLVSSRRGLYAGSFGLIGFSGWSVLGLAIRMVVRSDDRYVLRASAGIVADSDPAKEWNETLTKLGATYWAVVGKEIQ
jgi:anthranilate synthase component 1